MLFRNPPNHETQQNNKYFSHVEILKKSVKMGKLNVTMLRYLTKDQLRILTAVEMGMKNHELVPKALIVSIAQVKSGVAKVLMDLCRNRYEKLELSDFIVIESSRISHFGWKQGPDKHQKSVGTKALKLTLKCLKFDFYCIFNFQKLWGQLPPLPPRGL